MNTMNDIFKYEKFKLEQRKKALISLHRKLVTTISKIDLVSLQVNSEISFQPSDTVVSLTVFKLSGSDNKTFSFYSFWEEEKIAKMVADIIPAIKTDDFDNVKEIQTH